MSGADALKEARRLALAELIALASDATTRAADLVAGLDEAAVAGLELGKATEQARNAAARLAEALRLVERERDGAPAAPVERVVLRVVEKSAAR